MIVEDFKAWIFGIDEDTPIPDEVKHIYFVLKKSCGVFLLQYGGKELPEEKIISFEYFPLEAQYFSWPELSLEKNSREACIMLRFLVDEALMDEDFRKLFNNKNIHLCKYGFPSFYDYNYL